MFACDCCGDPADLAAQVPIDDVSGQVNLCQSCTVEVLVELVNDRRAAQLPLTWLELVARPRARVGA